MNTRRILLASALLLAALTSGAQPWQPLFNGKNLSGWKQHGGKSSFKVEDGVIVGTPRPGEENSFIVTNATYGDFILEFDFRISDNTNSGVQIRSHIRKEGDRVYGLQYEIDPSDRAWSGGIYDEGRRGWLYPLTKNVDAKRFLRHGEWNHARIEAYGNSVKTWLNGMPCAKLWDEADREGVIALQVHKTDSPSPDTKVEWKDIRIITTDVASYLSTQDIIEEYNCIDNSISPWEKANGWRLLWDGSTTTGWRGAYSYEFPSKGWSISDGVLTVNASGKDEKGGDIITEEIFHHCVIKVDFLLGEGAESGLKYFVDPDYAPYGGKAVGCEYQIVDDPKGEDLGDRSLGSLRDLIPAPLDKIYHRGGWNTAMIVVNANRIEHWLNDVRVLYYERNCPMWDALVSHSEYSAFPGYGTVRDGPFLIQDQGSKVSFKNIKFKELRKYPIQ